MGWYLKDRPQIRQSWLIKMKEMFTSFKDAIKNELIKLKIFDYKEVYKTFDSIIEELLRQGRGRAIKGHTFKC